MEGTAEFAVTASLAAVLSLKSDAKVQGFFDSTKYFCKKIFYGNFAV